MEIKESINKIIKIISSYEFHYQNEIELHEIIENILNQNGIKISREYNLMPDGIVDFFYDGIAFEIKTKGTKKAIYRQCRDYCNNESVKSLVLITSLSMGLPTEINNKPCYVYNLNTRK